MSDDTGNSRLAMAQARADAARARLRATIGKVQARARPKSLVHNVAETLKERGTDVAVGLVDTAKRKPVRTGTAVVLAGLLLARNPLMKLARRAVSRRPASKSPGKGQS